jgi:hypothetical protein
VTRTTTSTVVAPAVATSLTPSTTSPLFDATVSVTPVFSNDPGGTAVIGTSGSGSSNVTATASSGVPAAYATHITSATTFTLTVTNRAGMVATATSATVTPQTVSLTNLSPATPRQTVNTTRSFSVTAAGGATNTVTWSATGGSFTGSTWTAPGTPNTYTITATSVDDPTKHANATATVVATPVAGNLAASTTTPAFGATVTLTPTFSGGTATIGSGGQGSSDVTASAITNNGYSSAAITASTTFTLTVTNSADTPAVATATRTVVPTAVQISAITPANPSVDANTTQQFDAIASGGATNTITWSSDGGSFAGNVWTAPANNGIFTITATSDDDPSVSVTTNAMVINGLAGPVIVLGPIGAFAGTGSQGGGTLSALALATPLGTGTSGSSSTFSVTAAGPGPLSYQWYRIPAGSDATGLQNPVGDGSASLTLAAAATQPANDGDRYFVVVGNASGQAVSAYAPLAVGNGILLQASGQPRTAFAAAGHTASFTVTVASGDPAALQYQWYACAPGAAVFAAIPGATSATYATPPVQAGDSGTLYRCVVTSVDTGVSPAVTRDAALFVDTPGSLGGLADGWQLNGDAVVSGSGIQLTAAAAGQAGSAFWPRPVSTARLTLAFTVALDNPSAVPGDGFALVFADPSRGATAAGLGASGSGLGARGIPGAVLAVDTLADPAQGVPGQPGYLPADLPVPFLGLGRAEAGLWGQPWQLGYFALPGYPGSRTDPAAALRFAASTHAYRVTVADGTLTVTLDGTPVLTGAADLPPSALVGFTAATSDHWERVVVSDFSATLSVP